MGFLRCDHRAYRRDAVWCEERVGLVDAGGFAARRYLAFVGAPLFPLALTVVIVLCSIPVGWLLRFDVGVLLAALVWIFVLLGGLLAAVARSACSLAGR